MLDLNGSVHLSEIFYAILSLSYLMEFYFYQKEYIFYIQNFKE